MGRKKRALVVDVRPGESEDEALRRSQEQEPTMPIDDLEIESKPSPAKFALNQVAQAAADLTKFVAGGMKATDAVARVMKEHGVPVTSIDVRDVVANPVRTKPLLPTVEAPGLHVIDVEQISESPTNPRKAFDGIDELAASVRMHGVLTPVLVVPSIEDGKPFRLVFGHRRLRAAKKAGLRSLPAVVHAPMSEAEVLEAQLIENCQRQDIEELEEGEGYARLRDVFGYSVDQISVKVGKSKRTVYARIQLAQLVPEARAALNAGKLPPSTALLVARIPTELQARALAGLTQGDEPLSVRQASEYIQTNFMLKLADAPFDTGDDLLVDHHPSCKVCPQRTGNSRDLFADVGAADVCTNPTCFRDKVAAFWSAQTERADAKGFKVLPASVSRPLYRTGKLAFDADYVERNAPCPDDAKRRTWKKLADWVGVEPQVHVAADLNGYPHELYKRSDLDGILKELGVASKAAAAEADATKQPATPEDKARTQSEKKQREARQLVASEVLAQAVAITEKSGMHQPERLRLVVLGLLHALPPKTVCERRGVTEPALEKSVAKMDAKQLQALIFELATADWIGDSWDGFSAELKTIAKVFGADLKTMERDALAAVQLGLTSRKAKA